MIAGLLLLALALDVGAATRHIELRGAPVLGGGTWFAASLGLVAVALLQALRNLGHRRRKFRMVHEALIDPPPALPVAPNAPAIVVCAACAQPLRLGSVPRPVRFRCPKCQTVGVAQ